MKLKLSDEDREKSLTWCSDFIEHHCIYRCENDDGVLTSPTGGLHNWQFFIQTATLDQEFSFRIAQLFWDYYEDSYNTTPFQLGGCETGAVPLLIPLQRVAFAAGLEVNVFSIRKQAKTYGLKNWIEGRVIEDLPILALDDVVASCKTLETQAKRLSDMGFKLYPEAFSILSCKKAVPNDLNVGDTKIPVKVFFGGDVFTRTWRRYVAKYGKDPIFYGTVV